MYPPFFFGSTYITLAAQNSKTIRIIFLPKCTHKNCDFYAVFYTFFSAYFVTIRQNKIGFSDDIQRIFSHKPTLVGIPPCLILRKFERRGPSVFKKRTAEILIPLCIQYFIIQTSARILTFT